MTDRVAVLLIKIEALTAAEVRYIREEVEKRFFRDGGSNAAGDREPLKPKTPILSDFSKY